MKPQNRLLVIVAMAVAVLPGRSQSTVPMPSQGETPDETGIVVPAETVIPVRLSSTISSRSAFVGQQFYGQTFYPITVENRIAIPVGTYVRGTITQVKRQGLLRGKALIRLRCDSMTFPGGATFDLVSALTGLGGNGREALDRRGEPAIEDASARIKPEDVGTILETTLGGFLIGAILTGSRTGAGLGALGGGLAGLAGAKTTRRNEIVLPPGTDLNFRLTRPLVLDPSDSKSRRNE